MTTHDTCIGCKYANWKRTATGRLSPGGSGRCMYEWKPSPMPSSMYFLSGQTPNGGFINRHELLNSSCECFVGEEQKP